MEFDTVVSPQAKLSNGQYQKYIVHDMHKKMNSW